MFPTNTNAQEKGVSYEVTQFSVEDGLNQSMVTCVFVDESGLTWIGTGSGINYFDGARLHFAETNNNFGINDAIIRQITAWGLEHLLVCSSREIGLLNRGTFEFKSLYATTKSEPVILWSSKHDFHVYWSLEDGFFGLMRTPFLNLILPLHKLNTQIKNEPKKINLTQEGKILITHAFGLDLLDQNPNSQQIIHSEVAPVFLKNSQNETYIISDGSIFRYMNGKLELYIRTESKRIHAAAFSKNDALWFFDDDKMSLFKIDDKEMECIHLVERNGKHTDTISGIIKFISFDEQNNLFLGTDGCGFLTHRSEQFDFQKAAIGFTSTIARSKNYLWAGTVSNGLWKITPDFSKAIRVKSDLISEHTRILSLQVDQMNQLWVLTKTKLFVFNEQHDLVFTYQNIENDIIHSGRLFFIPPKTMILNISRSDDFNFFSQTVSFDCGFKPKPTGETKTDDYIMFMNKIDNNYWIAGRNGLYMNTKPNLEKAKNICAGNFYCVEKYNNTIIASSKSGFHFFDSSGNKKVNEKLQRVSKDLRIVAYGLIKDDYNRLWFSSNIGVGYIFKDSLHFFDKSLDFQSLEFTSTAFCSKKNQLYFGGVSGVNGIDSHTFDKSFKENNTAQPVLLNVSLNNQSLFSGIPPIEPSVVVEQYNGLISGQIAELDFDRPELNEYTFFLENYDVSWSKPRKSGYFEFGKLPHGDYTLLCRVKNAYGFWSKPHALLSIHVPTLFYQRWWFVGFTILLILFITVRLVRFYQKRKFQKVLLEINQQRELDQERLRISRDVHDELGGGLSKMLMISQLMVKKKEDSQSIGELSLTIKETCTNLIQNLSNVVWSLKNEVLSYQMLVVKLTEICASSFDNTTIEYQIQTDDKIDNDLYCNPVFVRDILPAFKEALTNIIKHAKATNVIIRIALKGNQLSIEITDNGVGFPPEFQLGNGLNNMRLRIESCGGVFLHDSMHNQGSTIIFKNLSLESN